MLDITMTSDELAHFANYHLREHLESMVHFIHTYCEFRHVGHPTDVFVQGYIFLPEMFKEVVLENVNNTLSNIPLLELSLRLVHYPDRVDRTVQTFVKSYTDEYTDSGFIQWATMLCTLASVFHRHGFTMALEIVQEMIEIICSRYGRYQAFVSLGCNV